jgi:methylated-DNA-[protein]-cysteine S-methyltransferase
MNARGGQDKTMLKTTVHTQFGSLTLTEEDGALVSVRWGAVPRSDHSPLLARAAAQLDEYARGEREIFDLPLRVTGSGTTRAVCAEMRQIPFGETRTYGDIAKKLGLPAQAVGQACAANPLPILIPCHRVMGAKGLTGFSGAGGVETKVALLRHEGAGGFLI